MILLAKNRQEKGDQLEQLTRKLIEASGYRNVVLNKCDVAGEIDVFAEFAVTGPEGAGHRLICECKAHRNAIDMPDWLKFLGKVYVDEAMSGQEVVGVFVSLTGVNGYVHGSYDRLKAMKRNIHLITGDGLIAALGRTHQLADAHTVGTKVRAWTQRQFSPPEVAYHDGNAYWTIFFGEGDFTVLDAKGDHVPAVQIADMVDLLKAETTVTKFIDLLQEAKAWELGKNAMRLVLAATMYTEGNVTFEQVMKAGHNRIDETELRRAAKQMEGMNWVRVTGDRIAFSTDLESLGATLADMFRFFLGEQIVVEALGNPWYDRHIDERLLDEACRVQGGLVLTAEDRRTAVQLMQWSPLALLYALTPDPMIVLHRQQYPDQTERFEIADQKHFMRSLYQQFTADYMQPLAGVYFGKVRALTEVATSTTLVIKRDQAVIHEATLKQRNAIVPVAEQFGGGYHHVLGIDDLLPAKQPKSGGE